MATIDEGHGGANTAAASKPSSSALRPEPRQRATPVGSATRKAAGKASASKEHGLRADRVLAGDLHGGVDGALRRPNRRMMALQRPVWDLLCNRYFRFEVSGWERLPEEP
jgi:MOSC domain-containing protein YiiM